MASRVRVRRPRWFGETGTSAMVAIAILASERRNWFATQYGGDGDQRRVVGFWRENRENDGGGKK